MKRLLIDLYCGAGAVSIGYAMAGWDVIGVDLVRQPRYPFPFIQSDALAPWIAELIARADAVHASPPCLRDTEMKHAPNAKGDAHPDLITPTRAVLKASGKPYVLENVMGADLHEPVILNGFMFDLKTQTSDGTWWYLERERKFEANWPIRAPRFTRRTPIIGVYGAHVRNRAKEHGGRMTADFQGEDKPRLMREAMGIGAQWGLTMAEMSQAVPPAYTQHVGAQLRMIV